MCTREDEFPQRHGKILCCEHFISNHALLSEMDSNHCSSVCGLYGKNSIPKKKKVLCCCELGWLGSNQLNSLDSQSNQALLWLRT